jgi:uncharacterized integral membrane protein
MEPMEPIGEFTMEKIKQITLTIKKWQAGCMLAAILVTISYWMAATTPPDGSALTVFHMAFMFLTGGAGTVIFIISAAEMWENWDA